MMVKSRMTVREQLNKKTPLSHTPITYFMAVFFVMTVVFSGCGDDDPAGPQFEEIVDVIISPDNAEFSVGEQIQFSAFILLLN